MERTIKSLRPEEREGTLNKTTFIPIGSPEKAHFLSNSARSEPQNIDLSVEGPIQSIPSGANPPLDGLENTSQDLDPVASLFDNAIVRINAKFSDK